MPESRSMESRVSRLEEKVESQQESVKLVPRLAQMVDTHEDDIRRVMPMFVEVAENRVRMEQMNTSLNQAIRDLKEFRQEQATQREADEKARDERLEDQRRERKKDRWAMIGVVLTTGMLIVAAIGLLVQIG